MRNHSDTQKKIVIIALDPLESNSLTGRGMFQKDLINLLMVV